MNYFVEKQYKYLGEVPYFKKNGLPSGYMINKGKVGCGGTSLALEDEKNTIVCVPFVNLIKNKMYKYNKDGEINVLGVYNGISDESIENYLKNKVGVKKIMCTYDSLHRVCKFVNPSYYLLVDELHLLFTQYAFRENAAKSVLHLYKQFNNWSFLTATPIEEDLMLEELKDIPVFNIDWEYKVEMTVKAIQCKQIIATIKKIIEEHLLGKRFGNAHIFINSCDNIAKIIKNCELDERNCRVIWGEGNEKYRNVIQGIRRSLTTDPVKKINMYTSTCFEGCDLFDEEGKIYIVSDSSKSQTLGDISTSIRQIAGRIRNTKYNEIEHLYTKTRYSSDLSYEEYKKIALEESEKASKWVEGMNNSDLLEGTKESEFAYVYKDNGFFHYDPNLLKLDIFNFKCLHHTYSLSVNISNEYAEVGFSVICSNDKTSDKLLKADHNIRTTFKDAVIEYAEIMKRKGNALDFCFTDNERLRLLREKYHYIDDAYRVVGMERMEEMKYNTTDIQRYIIVNKDKLDNFTKIGKLLSTVKGFELGAFITGSAIKQVLSQIYSSLGMTDKPTINDFRKYAVVEDKVKKIEGKSVRGYVIKYIKVQ